MAPISPIAAKFGLLKEKSLPSLAAATKHLVELVSFT